MVYFLFFSCEQTNEHATGCNLVSQEPLQLQLANALDPARDLQRLNSLIIANYNRLLNLFEEANLSTNKPMDQIIETLKAIQQSADSLNKVNVSYRSAITRDMKYGSFQMPIGDDNYLHMTRNGFGVAMSTTSNSQATSPAMVTTTTTTTLSLSQPSNDIDTSLRLPSNFPNINELLRCNDQYSQC